MMERKELTTKSGIAQRLYEKKKASPSKKYGENPEVFIGTFFAVFCTFFKKAVRAKLL